MFWFSLNLGLCFFNIALYGNRDQKYITFLSGYLHTLYDAAAFAEQGEEHFGLAEFFLFVVNNLCHYFLWIVLLGTTLASLNGEYKSELLLATNEQPNRRKKAQEIDR